MTSCQYGSGYDWIGVGTSGSASGPEESGGIFTAGDYNYVIYDSAGDSLDGGAAIHFETRAAGSTGAWTTILSEIGTFIGSSGHSGTVSVPTGDELRLAYHCGGNSCYSDENYMTLTPVVIPPTLPAAANGVGGSPPTGSEPADASFNVVSGESLSNSPAVVPSVMLKKLKSTTEPQETGWTDKWDICTGTMHQTHNTSSCNAINYLPNPRYIRSTGLGHIW